MSLDRLLRGHLASRSAARQRTPGVEVVQGRDGPVHRLVSLAGPEADTRAVLLAELEQQRATRRNR